MKYHISFKKYTNGNYGGPEIKEVEGDNSSTALKNLSNEVITGDVTKISLIGITGEGGLEITNPDNLVVTDNSNDTGNHSDISISNGEGGDGMTFRSTLRSTGEPAAVGTPAAEEPANQDNATN